MKINHEKTHNEILAITELIKKQAVSAKEYKNQKNILESDETMAQKYKNDRLAELRVIYINGINETKALIKERLITVADLETANEQILETDVPEFANTLAAINSAKGNLPGNVIENIKLNFAGQVQLLEIIEKTFDNYGIDMSRYNFSEYTKPSQLVIADLSVKVENIEQSEAAIFLSLTNIYKAIIHFGEVRGIVFSDSEKTFSNGVDDEIREELARQAMGLA